MSKKYELTRKQREARRTNINLIIGILALILISSFLIVYKSKNPSPTKYTPEQLLHDHDGDGIPDH